MTREERLIEGGRLVQSGMSVRAAAAKVKVSRDTLRAWTMRDTACEIAECGRQQRRHGLCSTHYQHLLDGKLDEKPSHRKRREADEVTVAEFRHMRVTCGMVLPRAILATGTGARGIVAAHERLGEPVPGDLRKLIDKSTGELHSLLDERRWIAG